MVIVCKQDIIILRHKLTEGLSVGETSEALRAMQGELQRLHVQVGHSASNTDVNVEHVIMFCGLNVSKGGWLP